MYAILTSVCYLVAAGILAADLSASRAPRGRLIGLIALAAHAYTLVHSGVHQGAINATLFNVLSASAWIVVAFLLLLSLWRNVLATAVIIFPGTVLWVLAAAFWPLPPVLLGDYGSALNVHIFSSMLAYGVLATAAANTLVLIVQERLLHQRRQLRWMRALPPLTASETLLFRMLAGGWVLLTLSLASGFAYVHDLFAQHLVHKTILSIIAWLVFSVLLLGRWRRGWRGRQALYLILAGVIILLLAYFGSKLVLEIVLQRSWQS